MARKNTPAKGFGPSKRQAFVDAIEQESSRLEAAQEVGVTLDQLQAALADDPAFRQRVDLAEREVMRKALHEAATSGNIVAILDYTRQHLTTAKRAEPFVESEMRQLSRTLKPLLD